MVGLPIMQVQQRVTLFRKGGPQKIDFSQKVSPIGCHYVLHLPLKELTWFKQVVRKVPIYICFHPSALPTLPCSRARFSSFPSTIVLPFLLAEPLPLLGSFLCLTHRPLLRSLKIFSLGSPLSSTNLGPLDWPMSLIKALIILPIFRGPCLLPTSDL